MFKGLIDKFDFGYRGDLGASFIEEVQRSVKISPSRDTYQRVQQVKNSIYSFVYENEWAGDLRTEGRYLKRGIGRAISREPMQVVWGFSGASRTPGRSEGDRV